MTSCRSFNDRGNNHGDYTLANIQILPMSENHVKDRIKYTPEEKVVKEREWAKKKVNKRKAHYLAVARARYHRNKAAVSKRRKELYKLNGRKDRKRSDSRG